MCCNELCFCLIVLFDDMLCCDVFCSFPLRCVRLFPVVLMCHAELHIVSPHFQRKCLHKLFSIKIKKHFQENLEAIETCLTLSIFNITTGIQASIYFLQFCRNTSENNHTTNIYFNQFFSFYLLQQVHLSKKQVAF